MFLGMEDEDAPSIALYFFTENTFQSVGDTGKGNLLQVALVFLQKECMALYF
jgi:hypothetical protein